MAIKPGSSPITFVSTSPTASGVLYCDEVSFQNIVQPFDRYEYDHAKLRSIPTTSGATPLIVQGFGNKPIQLLSTCTGDSPRPLTPDDSVVSSIKKRFNINRYTIQGAANPNTTIAGLYQVRAAHAAILDQFDMYLSLSSLELSYDYYVTILQPLTFSYLTTTAFTLSGPALSGSLSNCLLLDLQVGVEYEAPNISDSGATSTVLQDFSMTVDIRTISSRSL